MSRPLEGIKLIEVAQWAFVPASAGILSDLGVEVIKIEPPTGDALRGLKTGAFVGSRVDLSFQSYNRGKKSVTLDLKQQEGREVLMKMLEDCDVFLTNALQPARKGMGIDEETIRSRFPNIIYASGSGTGPRGPECNRGGYDSISFWARSGISSSLTEDKADYPVGPPGSAFGDTLSGSMLAGAICAALTKRAITGKSSSVDCSLLGTGMWAMQRSIAQSTMDGAQRYSRPHAPKPFNVLVANYRTADDRFVSLCMLQADKHWANFCAAAGVPEMASDPRYVDAAARDENGDACYEDMKALFAGKTLAEWRDILGNQAGPWDVVQDVGDLHGDQQVIANQLIQSVDNGVDEKFPLVAVPIMFDGEPMAIRPAPQLGADSDAMLAKLGYDEDAVIDLKVKGVVF